MIQPLRLGLLAKNPSLTSAQLDDIEAALEGRPSATTYQKIRRRYLE